MKKIKIRKLSKSQRILIIIFIILISLTLVVTLGRYVYTFARNLYFSTKRFYFQSDKLTENTSHYSLDYWNGVDPFSFTINMSSEKNNSLKSASDINYKITYECPDTVICASDKDTSIIYEESASDNFTVTLTPQKTFQDGDKVEIKITAESVKPYRKTLSATFELVVGKYGLSHEIDDAKGDVYLELKVTNSLETYTVKTAFGEYNAGDQISSSVYNSLTEEEKSNCKSATITVSFDPDVVYIDNNNSTFRTAYDIKTEKKGNFDYVNEFTFDIEATSGTYIRFYKKDSTKDYSAQGDGVIKVNYSF